MQQGRNAGVEWLAIFLEDGSLNRVRALGIDTRPKPDICANCTASLLLLSK